MEHLVAVLISRSQTCFACSQSTRGSCTPVALDHGPSVAFVRTDRRGVRLLSTVDVQARGLTCCEKGFRRLEALPQTNIDNSSTT